MSEHDEAVERRRRIALAVNVITGGGGTVEEYVAHFSADPRYHVRCETREGTEGLTRTFGRAGSAFPNGIVREVRSSIAEGNRVAVQYVARAVTAKGEEYENEYVKIFEFDENDKITDLWEYLDTGRADRMLH